VRHAAGPALVAAVALALAACSTGSATSDGSPSARGTGDCPATPVDVVVSVDQWGDLVRQLGGACADVHTVLASSSVDPHDYEPSPADAVEFSHAQLVVVNGAGYDDWATKLAGTAAGKASLVDAGKVVGVAPGGNPHLWYSPDYVPRVLDAVTAELKQLDPAAASYFAHQRAAVTTSLEPYTHLVATLKKKASGRTYGATEGVFDYMAQAVGLVDKTPQGYHNAAAAESDPSPGDLKAFENALTGHQMDVLVDNTQTEGSLPAQVRKTAESAGVPVVEVTETVAPGAASFQDWQMTQLTALAKALDVKP
jgi:zinc/manganese transport system substrate-binding protein